MLQADSGSGRDLGWLELAAVADFCQSEIENLGMVALGDENIRRLNVAMDNVLGVGRLERVGNFNRQTQKQSQFDGTEGDAVFQRRPFQKLHRDERLIVVLANFINRADVGMVQRGSGAGFTPEAFERLCVVGEFVRKKLQSDEAPELGVFGFVDDSHPAAAQLVHNAIVRDGLADHEVR